MTPENKTPSTAAPENKTPDYTLKDFDEVLFEALRDPEAATLYLQDAWEDSTEEFLVALRKYIQANGGMAQCAAWAHVSRAALSRMLSETGNPELRSIRAVLQASGIVFSVARRPEADRQPELAAA